MDDGSIRHVEGFQVQHNLSRGPGKGGIRYHTYVDRNKVIALSVWMTIKFSFWWAKGGLQVDPSGVSA